MQFLAALPLLVAGSAAPAALLERLAAHDLRARETRKRLVANIAIVGEELDSRGRPSRRTETLVRVAYRGDREITEIVRATEDGKDVTDAAREKQRSSGSAKGGQEPSPPMKVDSPFAGEEQGKYAFEVLEVDAATSRARIRFSPRGEPRPELWTGEAVVDVRQGQLVSMSSRPSKPPRFVDSLSLDVELGIEVEGTRMPSKVAFRGEGGFLFIRKRLRGWTEFEYAPVDAPPESAGARKP